MQISSTQQVNNNNTLGTVLSDSLCLFLSYTSLVIPDCSLPSTPFPPFLPLLPPVPLGLLRPLLFLVGKFFFNSLNTDVTPGRPRFLVLARAAVMEMITPTLGASVLGDTSSPHIPHTGLPQTGRRTGLIVRDHGPTHSILPWAVNCLSTRSGVPAERSIATLIMLLLSMRFWPPGHGSCPAPARVICTLPRSTKGGEWALSFVFPRVCCFLRSVRSYRAVSTRSFTQPAVGG